MKILPLGDSSLLVDFGDESRSREEGINRALAAARAMEGAELPDVIEVTPAFQSIALYLGAAALDDAYLVERITALLSALPCTPRSLGQGKEIPVCYDEEFALDHQRVAKETGLPFERIVQLHCAAEFTVACLGFMPGFPYLTDLPQQLRVPRLPTPRTEVPAGSVAIANDQAGVYPFTSPGGWNIIGRTSITLFDPEKNPPAFLAPGDRVRFRPITRAEFDGAGA